MVRTLYSFTVAALLCCTASLAFAAGESKPVEGLVVKIADGELIVDLGDTEGVPSSATVLIYRRLVVTHPVTQREIVDRFLIGTLMLDQVGSKLSISRTYSGLSRPPQVGDFVVYLPDGTPVQKEELSEEQRAMAESAEPSPQKDAVDQLVLSTLGKPITKRIELYMNFLQANPDNPYAEAIGTELAWMRQRLDEERGLAEERAAEKDAEKAARVREAKRSANGTSTAPARVAVDAVAPVVATFANPENVQLARVFIRLKGAPRFNEVTMQTYGGHAGARTSRRTTRQSL